LKTIQSVRVPIYAMLAFCMGGSKEEALVV